MLTLLDAISIAGSRNKQNDDSWGMTLERAFVIDGATDLHDAPISGERSDAAWLSRVCAQALYAAPGTLKGADLFDAISDHAARQWGAFPGAATAPAWKSPLAAALIVTQRQDGIDVLETGDCRLFVSCGDGDLDLGDGAGRTQESVRAAQLAVQAKETLDLGDQDRMAYLRKSRTKAIQDAAALGVRAPAAAFYRCQTLKLSRPSLCLIATDGFSSLVDVYGAYSSQSILSAAMDKGLAALAGELRQIEAKDQRGEKFARWKTSDDATAILFRYE